MMKSVLTRFRAYQLGCCGSSFSYFADGSFTVIEARLNECNFPNLKHEMFLCGVDVASGLHVTSWDADHCMPSELQALFKLTRPMTIECPGYQPSTTTGRACQAAIEAYRIARRSTNRPVTVRHVTPAYIAGLEEAKAVAFRDVTYHPRAIDPDSANNNSTVKLFRGGSFNVLSLGDVEDPLVSAALRRQRILQRETDVMILAHHGADNGFTSRGFLEKLSPSVAVCSSNYDNQYDHPRQEIRDLLYEGKARLVTTKTGDVVIKSIGDHTGHYRVVNLKAGSTEISSICNFVSKKSKLLSHNQDTIKQLYAPRPQHPRR